MKVLAPGSRRLRPGRRTRPRPETRKVPADAHHARRPGPAG